jgi:hypothetical protein
LIDYFTDDFIADNAEQVLSAARSGDDGDVSDAGDAGGCAQAPRASPRRHGAAKCQLTPPTPAAASVIIDVNNFTTWTPDTEELTDWDSSSFPSDAVINICTVRCYMAVAMIMLYQTELRERHKPFQKKSFS